MQANNNINSPNQRHLTWPPAQESCHETWALTRRPGVGSSPESQGPLGRILPKEGAAGPASAVRQQPHHRPRPLHHGSETCSSTLSQRARPSTMGRAHLPQLTFSFLSYLECITWPLQSHRTEFSYKKLQEEELSCFLNKIQFQYLFYFYFFLQLCDSTCISCKFVYLLLIFKSDIDIFCSLRKHWNVL